jgi:hypothetical protein
MSIHNDKKRAMPTVLKALPLDRDLKVYYHSKYEFLRSHNGPEYAAQVFQALRQSVMELISIGPYAVLEAKDNLATFDSIPIRKNGWLKKLLDYAATDPISVIQFLKLYTTEPEPLVSVSQAAEKQAETLTRARPCTGSFAFYKAWCILISIPFGAYRKEHDLIKSGYFSGNTTHVVYYKGRKYAFPGRDASSALEKALYRMLTRGIYPCLATEERAKVLKAYLQKWTRILSKPCISEQEYRDAMWKATPSEASYASSEYGNVRTKDSNEDFERDLNQMLSFMSAGDFEPYRACLDQTLLEALDDWWAYSTLPNRYQEELIADGLPVWLTMNPVGTIHHIPKKGTVKRRSIAAPNRFLQACFKPCQMNLRAITGRLPRNAQFDQSRFDNEIQENLDHGFAGCWDLSSATDWLPLSWFSIFADHFGWFDNDPIGKWSYQLFQDASRGFWDNDGANSSNELVRWQRGQPLGTWPSFEVLTITHTLVLESLSLLLGRLDSPYAILGDDNVIFDWRLWVNYSRVMRRAGNPISEHKSYSGNMVEFAGKVFVKHQARAYSSNLTPVYLTNLFDFQISAGKAIKWRDLPSSLRSQFAQLCHRHSEQADPRSVYIALQAILGIRVPKLSEESGNLISNYFRNSERFEPELINEQSWVRFGGYVFTFQNPQNHHRFTEKWFRKKFRPVSTRTLVERATKGFDTFLPV